MSAEDSGSDSSFAGDELRRAFWAVELAPNKEFVTGLPLDLRITSAVLPASAKDTGRSVVTVTFEEEPEKTFSIVSLNLASNDSQTINVRLDGESEVKFFVHGKNPVHLSGFYVPPADDGPEGLYDDDEIDSDDLGDEMGLGEDSESEEEEIDPKILAQIEKKRKALTNGGDEGGNKKPKANAPQQQQQQQKKEAPAAKPQQQQQEKKPQQQQQKGQQQKAFPNGLKYTIVQEGSGQEATKGKKVGVKYVGKLTKNGKVFDASKTKPFSFTLGAREVITGWDLGVAGMKIGEKRQLIIPPELAYGAQGAGRDIPPNSTLTFDVELVFVGK